MVYVLPGLALLLAGVLGHWLARRGGGPWVLGLEGIALIAGFLTWREGQAAQGFDGIGYAITLALVIMPVILGLAFGAFLGLYRRRRDVQNPDHD